MDRTLGIYSDDVFWVERTPAGTRVSADQAFLVFACAVGERFGGFVLFGRTVDAEAPSAHLLPPSAGLAPLPYYESLRRPGQLLRALIGTVAGMWRGLGRVDTVWILGPNPFGVLLVILSLLRRKRVTLGVRQDTLAYFRSRLPGPAWVPALGLAWGMDRLYRLLARRLPTTVVGEDLARGYSGPARGPGGGTSVLPMKVTLMRSADVARRVPDRGYAGEIELLSVGRIDREKNPLLLVEAMARLEREESARYRLRWAGSGPLAQAVRLQADQLGVAGRVELCGYVPFGPELLSLYRQAHIFVHVSLTEGVPQVLLEALACGTPVVATDVGGVREALDGGRAGALVPPSDLDALVAAIRAVASDAELRSQLVVRGLELAREATIETEAARVASFLAGDPSSPARCGGTVLPPPATRRPRGRR